jgi:hypothetical protein
MLMPGFGGGMPGFAGSMQGFLGGDVSNYCWDPWDISLNQSLPDPAVDLWSQAVHGS